MIILSDDFGSNHVLVNSREYTEYICSNRLGCVNVYVFTFFYPRLGNLVYSVHQLRFLCSMTVKFKRMIMARNYMYISVENEPQSGGFETPAFRLKRR